MSISAGKYWTAAVTTTGDVYMWDGKKNKDMAPIITRLHGVKRATSVCVGETHLLVLCALYHPAYPSKSDECHLKPMGDNTESEELDEEIPFDDIHMDTSPKAVQIVSMYVGAVPSLKCLCEKVAAEFLVEPKNAIQLLEIADSLEAEDLRKHCEVLSCSFMLNEIRIPSHLLNFLIQS